MQKILLVALLCLSAPAIAQDPCHQKTTPECLATQQERCHQANDMGLDMARRLPVENARDAEHKQILVDKVETLLSRNRASGVDECITWGELNRIAVHQ